MYQIAHYLTPDHQDIYIRWLRRLRDREAQVAIIRRLARIEQGSFGDHKFCRDGVWELRIPVGPGYRVYYALTGRRVILLLCAGDKSSQSEDIERAASYWRDWQQRKEP